MEDLRDIVLAAGGLGWYTRTGQLSWGIDRSLETSSTWGLLSDGRFRFRRELSSTIQDRRQCPRRPSAVLVAGRALLHVSSLVAMSRHVQSQASRIILDEVSCSGSPCQFESVLDCTKKVSEAVSMRCFCTFSQCRASMRREGDRSHPRQFES